MSSHSKTNRDRPKCYGIFFKSRLPFNWTTPLGYLGALFLQAAASYFTLLSTASILCLLVGLCLLNIAIVEDLTNDLRTLSVTAIPDTKYDELMKEFRNSMQLYSRIKELGVALVVTCYKINHVSLWLLLDLSTNSTGSTNISCLFSFYGLCRPSEVHLSFFNPNQLSISHSDFFFEMFFESALIGFSFSLQIYARIQSKSSTF